MRQETVGQFIGLHETRKGFMKGILTKLVVFVWIEEDCRWAFQEIRVNTFAILISSAISTRTRSYSMTCKHERRTDFGMKHSEHPHEYCPECGWHRYCGKEYAGRMGAGVYRTKGDAMDIKDIAILYGDTRHGRSCGICVYYDTNLATGGFL